MGLFYLYLFLQVHYRIHKSSLLVSLCLEPDQSNAGTPPHSLNIHFNIFLLLRLGLPSALFLFGFPTKVRLSSLVHAT